MATAQDAGSVGADEDVVIKKIEVSGNFEVSDDVIMAVVQSRTGEPINTQLLEDDLQRIFDLGFFSEEIKARLSEYEGGAKITFKVVENPVVNKIEYSGNTVILEQALRDVMQTKENEILNKVNLEQDVKALEQLYKDRGFIVARVVDLQVGEDNVLRIEIKEGVVKDIEIIYVIRNDDTDEIAEESTKGKTLPKVILREMRTKKGDVLNAERIRLDLQRVFNLGFFEDVTWDFDTDPGRVDLGSIILQVKVEEAKTGQVGFGAGYSSSTGLTGFLSYSERNLSGMGRRVNSQIEFGGKQNDFQVGYFEPWIDKKHTSFEINLYNTSTENLRYGLGGVEVSDYAESHQGFDITVGRPLSDYTRAFVGFKAESVNIEPAAFDYLDGAIRSTSLSLRTDTRNNIFNPSSGRLDTGTMEVNGSFLGGDYDYQKFSLDLRRFYPVKGNKQIFGVHMFMGMSMDNVPRFDYFDIGGVNTVRGYEEYEFAGSKAVYFNAEYRFALAGNVSGVLFSDAGGVWSKSSEMSLDPDDYVKAVGLGLRLNISYFGGLGPIRLDYAYALSREETKIHFGFGQMF
jgi:outer membrane protein insertion porin family